MVRETGKALSEDQALITSSLMATISLSLQGEACV
jgi:hypothetical protein